MRVIKITASIFILASLNLAFFSGITHAEECRVDSGDVLLITVYEQPDLTSKVMVRPDGKITFPLLGDVDLRGLTASEIGLRLKSLLEKDYLVNPQVAVFIEKYTPEKVLVMGFVNKPGEYEIFKDRPTTALEAIAMAGGFKDRSFPNGTKIIRVENGEEVTIPIKAADIAKRGDKEKNMPVKAGDVVIVPESFF